jgi:hypothetical protein
MMAIVDRRSGLTTLLRGVVVAVMVVAARGEAAAQPERDIALRQELERRYDVVRVADGILLRAKTPDDVRFIEVTNAGISVDGRLVSGAELRDKLGADARLILQLSYLDADARNALFPAAPTPAPVERERTEPPEPAPPDAPARRRARNSGNVFRLGRDVTVRADERIDGDVISVGGTVNVDGEVRGNAVAIGGNLVLGPQASVRDAVVIGGRLTQAPTARVGGELVEIGPESLPLGELSRHVPGIWWSWWLGSAFAFLSTIVRVGILCLLAALVLLLARDQVERVSVRAASEPLKSGAIGILAQLLFLPVLIITIIILVVTIVGIPLLVLLPFAILGLGLVALVGFTAVAYHLGRLLAARLTWIGQGPYAATFAGILLLLSPVLIARLIGLAGAPLFPMTFGLGTVGLLLEYLAWTVGFGAVALARFSRPPMATMS